MLRRALVTRGLWDTVPARVVSGSGSEMGAARRLRLYRKLAPIFFAGEALKSARMAMKIANATKEDREDQVIPKGFRERLAKRVKRGGRRG